MRRPSTFALATAFPSSLLLLYLAMHTTEGWQFFVVAGFMSCFIAAWRRHSKAWLVAGYVVTVALTSWVAWVNL
ncbi:MAG: hypothetical protein E6H52_09335 [Betaproteobacteria bacterium]|nr:MAG: hypothetical protein E6H52_09335 [Betaproteobacteria bacterium]